MTVDTLIKYRSQIGSFALGVALLGGTWVYNSGEENINTPESNVIYEGKIGTNLVKLTDAVDDSDHDTMEVTSRDGTKWEYHFNPKDEEVIFARKTKAGLSATTYDAEIEGPIHNGVLEAGTNAYNAIEGKILEDLTDEINDQFE